jgi:hypothetical protein
MVSVSAFTKLLVDEIMERLSYVGVQKDVANQGSARGASITYSEPLISQVTVALADFPRFYKESSSSGPIESEAQLMGALAGFLTSVLPRAQVSTGRVLHGPRPYYVDLMVTLGNERILIELKRGDSPSLVDRGVTQLLDYLVVADAKYGILFLYSEKSTEYNDTIWAGVHTANEIHVIRSATSSEASEKSK